MPILLPVDDWKTPTLPTLDRHTDVTLDCETDGLETHLGARPVGAAIRLPATGESFYVPWAHRGGQNLDAETVRRWMRTELKGKRIRNLNTRFDIKMLRAWGVDLADLGCTFRDVAHSAALLDDHRRRFSLDALSTDYLGSSKHGSARKAEINELAASEVAAYAIQDVTLVDALYDVFKPKLTAEDLDRVHAVEDGIIPVVCEMEMNGLPIDEALLHQWVARSEEILEQLQWDINREAGFQVNSAKAADLTKLFRSLQIENPNRTKQGAPSYTAEFMRSIAHPLVQKVVKAGKLMDLRSKYLLPYSKLVSGGKLYGSFHQLRADEYGTVSGRFSSANPNMQQVMNPGKQKRDYGDFEGETFIIKKLFVPENGVFFEADQQAVEFRFAAHYSNAKRVLDAYARDPETDFHNVVRDMIRTQRVGFEREPAKACNFTRLYGGGRATMGRRMGTTEAETTEILRIYDAEFPEMKQILDAAKATAEKRGYIKTILGRRSRFGDKESRTYKALNCALQGSSADLNKMTLVEVYKHRKTLGLTLRGTCHDALTGDLVGPVAPVVEFLNRQLLPLRVPIIWKAGTGANWAEAK